MGKHSIEGNGISYWEARRRRKDLRNRTKPPKRKRGPTRKRWFVMIFVIGLVAGGALGYYAKPLAKVGARLYLSVKQHQWQPSGAEKKEVEKALTSVSPDPNMSVNTLVIGADIGSNKGEGGFCRSDVMMLVCLQERDKKAVVLSIPRDTKIELPGYGAEKINAAHSYGGPSGAIDAVTALTGIPVHHYVSMDFDGFARIVNAVGGVPIHLNSAINDPHAGYLPAGDQVLDGWQALVLVRSRKLPGGDIDRIASQQAFLKALVDKAAEMRSVWKAKQIVDIVSSTCKMDYSASELETLAEELQGFPIENVQYVTVPGDAKTISGASYFIVDQPALAEIATQVKTNNELTPELVASLRSNGSQTRVEEQYGPDSDVITVLSGAKNASGAVPVIAEELRLMGHEEVFEKGQAKETYEQTTIYFREEAKAAAEELLTTVPELQGAVLAQDNAVSTQYNAPVVVVLGRGFPTPSIAAIYGRIIKPAVEMDDLGKKVKNFS